MKKCFSVLLSVLILCGTLGVFVSAQDFQFDETYILANLNDSDSVVNSKDSFVLRQYMAGNGYVAANVIEDAADLSADGIVNLRDSHLMKQILVNEVQVSDLENGKQIYKLTVGGTDISEFCIVIPADADEETNANYAAHELKEYIEIANGASLTIVNGEENAPVEHKIIFHAVDLYSEYGQELGIEGYRYAVVDGNLEIYGTLRGNMYAVYAILEDLLGYDFYSDSETFLLKSRVIDIPAETDVTFVPKLSYRFICQGFDTNHYDHFYPKRLNGTQIYRNESNYKYGTLTGPHFINAHSFGYYWQMATGDYTDDEHLHECYLTGEVKEESDYSSTGKPAWQPCAYNDRDYENILTGMLRTIYMIQTWGHKFIKDVNYIMSCSPCDNTGGFCTCRYCGDMANNINPNIGLVKKEGYDNVYTMARGKGLQTKEGYSGVYLNFTNRAAEDVRRYYEGRLSKERTEEYPDMTLMTISYEHSIPETIRPSSNIIYFFCGQGCNNHRLGSGMCEGSNNLPDKNKSDRNNKKTEAALIAMAEYCHEAGAKLWYWHYPVTYTYVMSPCPNIVEIYEDFDWLINTVGVDGIYYEGGGADHAFEYLKSYIASEKLWHTDMTMEDFEKTCKKYLYMYYGDGYEDIYQYIMLQEEAGNRAGCFVNNYSTPRAMYDFDYVAEHFVEMRTLLLNAREGCRNDEQRRRMDTLIITCDFTGLCASYDSWYANGTDETKAEYVELCNDMLDRMIRIDMTFGADSEPTRWPSPTEIDVTKDLFEQVYG